MNQEPQAQLLAPAEELDVARQGALLVESPFDALIVTGRDRVTWLNGMLTCDVAKAVAGAAVYGLHVGKTGRIVAEVWVDVGADDLFVAVPRGRGAEFVAALDRFLIMERCELAEAPWPRAFVLAWGPGAASTVEVARSLGLRASLGRRAGLPVGLVQGEPEVVDAWRAQVGSAASCAPATAAGWERTRVELGVGTYGIDFDETSYPQEAALEVDAVSFSKGCYLGQEAVFMMQERGHPPRRMVQLELEGDGAVAPGTEILVGEGKAVGTLTSCVARPAGALGLGTVKWKLARPGTEVSVAGRRAVVTPLLAVTKDS